MNGLASWGFVLVTASFLVAFCYGSVAITVLFGGSRALPPLLRRLLETNPRPSASRVASVGRLAVSTAWLLVVALPQILLLRELLDGRLTPVETAAVIVEFSLCAAWVVFLGWRYGSSGGG